MSMSIFKISAAVFNRGEFNHQRTLLLGRKRTLLLGANSEGLSGKPATMPMTLFEFHGATQWCLYLTRPPFVAQRANWTSPNNYSETQALAQAARAEGIEVIRYESVRLPKEGRCLAIMTPDIFRAVAEPYRPSSSHGHYSLSHRRLPFGSVRWQRTLDGDSYEIRYLS